MSTRISNLPVSRRTALSAALAGLAALPASEAAARTIANPKAAAMIIKPMSMLAAKLLDLGPVAIAGAVIRLEKDPNGPGVRPYIYANSAHFNAGVTGVRINDSGELEITVANEGRPIVSCGVWMDETIGGTYGVTGGISGGLSLSRVRLNRGGSRIWLNGASGRAIAGDFSNLWCSWTYGPKP